ncbi:hypothetical protein [Methylobacterium brachythecii]|uniref:Uncharacterized protein n=1 Tax=Methylobacterium brachythecii TaxID=1176177 RepID=A0A7W6F537_9HYPH|nr:hypothetical protein [Methylobacterium brachythecii]MBB3900918.1 hypothetical protein [Methylobacterium brachythecii]GLS46154.1 hypothetical protein GCM10007884_41450 [Methylobacterium brachythecii]
MSVVTRCGAVSLLFGLLLAAPALAQTTQAPPSWTDPPARGAEGVKPAETKPAEAKPGTPAPIAEKAPADTQSARKPEATPAERAATTLGVKPVETGKPAASNFAMQTRRTVVRPRMVERPMVIARRRVHVADRPNRRIARRSGRHFAYAAEYGSRRRLAGWGDLIDENRVSREARAREAGYTLTRIRAYGAPEGPRFQPLLPFDSGGPGDLD